MLMPYEEAWVIYIDQQSKASGYNDIDEDDYDHILDMDIHRKHHHEYAITTPPIHSTMRIWF